MGCVCALTVTSLYLFRIQFNIYGHNYLGSFAIVYVYHVLVVFMKEGYVIF